MHDNSAAHAFARRVTLPPPWVPAHPHDPYGQYRALAPTDAYVYAWQKWWNALTLTHDERLAYLRAFPPPQPWARWAIQVVLAPAPGADLSAYFTALDLAATPAPAAD